MKPGTINLNGKKYPYQFNQRARRLFMEKNNIEYFEDYSKLLQKTEPHPTKGMSITGMKIFGDLVVTALQSADENFNDFDSDSLMDQMMKNPEMMQEIGKAFANSMEQEDPKNKSKNKNPDGSRGKSNGVK